jgi:SAM-dependent methyltransferase
MNSGLLQNGNSPRGTLEASARQTSAATLRILVALASHGHKNDAYLARVIDEYRSMPYQIHLVVLSNVPRSLGPGVEVVVGLPDKNPWSLPFTHKRLFSERIDQYDLFIYAEDDILITQRNIEAFLRATTALPADVIAGFVHAEKDDSGSLYFDPVLSHFHWDPASVRSAGDYTFAFFTNEHSACFLLTREQLRRGIGSGGFLVPPHEGRYDMLCTAATDPYTQCGFRKMICVSHLEDFTVYHLPNNKFRTRPYRAASFFERQVESLLSLEKNGRQAILLFDPETKVPHAKWSKDYYEPAREEVISLVPGSARSVLSIGCGWGATERRLVQRGLRVAGIPIDPIIGSCAEDSGIEMIYGDFETARRKLEKDCFDCILLVDTLHLVSDPVEVLASFTELLSDDGIVIITTPNFASLPVYWRRLTRHPQHKDLGNPEKTGIHLTSRGVISKWLRRCGMVPLVTRGIRSKRAQLIQSVFLGLPGSLLASELLIVGHRKKSQSVSSPSLGQGRL